MKTIKEYRHYERLLERVGKLADCGQRLAVIDEAISWFGTKFHNAARIKGVGIDCSGFLLGTYHTVGVIGDPTADYEDELRRSGQWHLHKIQDPHKSQEPYLDGMLRHARKIEGPPECADVAMFHIGRHYAHAAIVVEWPDCIIHAPAADIPGGVQLGNAAKDAFLLHGRRQYPPIFFRPRGWQ